MDSTERVSLLRPGRPERSSYAGLPTRRGNNQHRFGDVSLSSGGGSWNRRIDEYLHSPPSSSGLSTSLDSLAARRQRSDIKIHEDLDRRPYHYGSRTDMTEGLVGPIDADPVEAANFRRYQYYTRLQNQTGVNLDLLNIPGHVVPPNFYTIHIPGINTSGKQSSLVTIFSIWNTMLGTSLLSMPWAVQQSGLLMGMLMIALTGGICLYTAYRILQVYTIQSRTTNISEFSDLCGLVLGKWAELLASVFSVSAILGAAIVYWVLMSNFLFTAVDYFHDLYLGVNMTDSGVYCPSNTTASDQQYDLYLDDDWEVSISFDKVWGLYSTVPFFLIILLYPLVNFKSATFFTKFNSLGTISILFITGSVLYRCYLWGLHADFRDITSPEFIPLYKSSFPSLTGILALGLFIHNAIITIMSNNKNPENNGRDMSIAYFLVASTYMLIGTAFYIAFPLPKDCIEDNLFNNFLKHDGLTLAAKVFLFFQMATVFPLIMYILRVSVMYLIFRKVWPGLKYVGLLNAVIISICICFAIFMPKIGTIIRYSGAACGMSMIFTLPVLVHLANSKRAGHLTCSSILLHILIITFGLANFIAQFFI